MKVPNRFTEMWPEYPVGPDGCPIIDGAPLRVWGQRVFTDYVEYFVGKDGWKQYGASSPAHVVDCLFACIQVAMLGGAKGSADADAKRAEMDKILIYISGKEKNAN